MKKTMIAAALTLGLATQAWAQEPQAPQQPIKRADFLARSQAQFVALDANHDGVATKDELIAVMTKDFGGPPPAEIVDKIFAALDTNGDGKATAAEVEAQAASHFDQWDTNHDGTLTPDEMMAGRAAMRAQQQKQ
jgi:hypothetical protein